MFWGVASPAEQAPTTLAVLNFVNRNPGDGWDWLEKGLADMLITDLQASGKFQVVDRERTQFALEEMALAERGLVDPQTAQRLGKVLGVEWVAFGTYFREEGNIEIECHIVETATQRLRRVEWVRGPDRAVLELEKELALKVVENLGLALSEEERVSLLRMPTRSVDAAARFYDGLDCYDRTENTKAFVEFRGALRQDPDYVQARYWLARVYENLGEQGHAAVELGRLVKARERLSPRLYYTVVFALGHMLELEGRRAEAVQVYGEAADYFLARFDAVGRITAGLEEYAVLRLRARADSVMVEEYRRTGRLVSPPHGVITLSVESPVYGDDLSTYKRFWDAMCFSSFEFHTRFWPEYAKLVEFVSNGVPEESYVACYPSDRCSNEWSEEYVFRAEEGYLIDAVTVELTGMAHPPVEDTALGLNKFQAKFGCFIKNFVETYDFTPFEYQYGFHDTAKTTRTMVVTLPRPQEAVRGRVYLWNATLFDWKVKAQLSPKPVPAQVGIGTVSVTSAPSGVYVYLDGQALGRTPVVNGTVSPGSHEVTAELAWFAYRVDKPTGEVYTVAADYSAPPQTVEIAAGETVEVFFPMQEQVRDERGGAPLKEVEWRRAVTSPRSLSVEGLNLFQDQRGTFWLVWAWGARYPQQEEEEDYDLWISSSRDGMTWGQPRKLALSTPAEDTAPQMLQTEDGRYWLAWIRDRDVCVSSSSDTLSWTRPTLAMGGVSRMFVYKATGGGLQIVGGSDGEVLKAVTSADGTRWSAPTPVASWAAQFDFVFRDWWLARDATGTFYLMWCACPTPDHTRLIFLARSRAGDGLSWSEGAIKTALDRGIPLHGETFSSPVTGTGDPLLLIDRDGLYHVLSRSNGVYHSTSRDGQEWTPWQRIGTNAPETCFTRLHSAIQDRRGAFWLAMTTWELVPGEPQEKLGSIWVAVVDRFDQWGGIP